LYRTYPGNGSDQAVLAACLGGLAQLHEALDSGEGRERPAQRTVVRDGGFWSPQLELDLDAVGYYSLISLPLGHKAAEEALQMAALRGAMKPLSGKLSDVRAARVRTSVGELDRTLVVVESQELLAGQKRGIAVALRKAKVELGTLEGLIEKGRITRSRLELRVKKALAREHLSSFVVATIAGSEAAPTLHWHVDAALRRELERTRLGRRVLCTDRPRLARAVECRGAVPQSEERRRGAVGPVAPVGRRLAAPAHLCDGARPDAGELGPDCAAHRRFGTQDDGRTGRDQGDTGEDQDWSGGTTANGDAGTGARDRAAPSREGLRAAKMGAGFLSCMTCEPVQSRFTGQNLPIRRLTLRK
jgi:hypothetical protein